MCNLANRSSLRLLANGLIVLLWLTSNGLQADEIDANAMLMAADHYRLDSEQARVVTEVSEYEQQQLINQRRYHVYLDGNNSLVMFKSVAELGQKMLMLGQQYWLIMPRSSRPIRITPMQKLLGQASIGDIATLTWHRDYDITQVTATELTLNEQQYSCYQLQLSAKTDSNSYQRITLWLDKQDNFPLQAAFYLSSGKLAKMAQFHAGELNGQRRVVTMRLSDKLQPLKTTEVQYLNISHHPLPASYFNPVFLTRTVLEQL
ncbi:outer membrane lipoprotein-sorting protein [Shewanella dokdonensis]|uniref:Outer membrane lipoprotein-sorting protein n=1 Tax=Shewanella dokdonensis TaxID=712036 RepID=A0ABX8DFX9_9GAMM|nr:outer membrane lipoprotein-sorting protein [Shewanella dokdonensis]MCL1073832.1 outer membrane lipoprotein-sorting protein [Shewanella dokdonensis]QVK23620.1 outer membrane lipoprotein-sorting protein [Shewanella dokdonensis]